MTNQFSDSSLRSLVERNLCDAENLWAYHLVFDPIQKYDAILCLGSYDSRVAERCADLIQSGVSDVAVVTGGFGNWTRGKFSKPEAEIFADVIEARGIPRSELILETEATNIGENISFSQKLLLHIDVKKILIATKPQTQRRAFATARKIWPQVEVNVTAPELSLFEQARDGAGLLNLIDELVGDLERIQAYPRLGFQIELAVPQSTLTAYERLRLAGFDRHCMKK